MSLKPNAPAAGSRLAGFYALGRDERLAALRARVDLTDEDLEALRTGGLEWGRADKMVENCVGVFGLPVGVGLNFLINGRDYLIPMVVEEPSVVAAVSHVARLARPHGGFRAEADEGLMIAQVQVVGAPDPAAAAAALLAAEPELLALADAVHPNLVARGGGARGVEVRVFEEPFPMLALHLLVDCVDAMGANAVNAMAEGVAGRVEGLTGGRVYLRILSNLADRRLARASLRVPEEALAAPRAGMGGAEVAEGVVQAYRFAEVDPYRAATHNKGIMNGVDAVAIATGNDWRGVEAGAHAYAARGGRYRSLTRFWRAPDEAGAPCLWGEIELPLAVATVGGSTGVHPTIRALRKLLGVESARELAGVMAAVGLSQNLAALKALATEGIQRGHMSLHARSVALAAGAREEEVAAVAAALVSAGSVKHDAAAAALARLRAGEAP